MYTHLILPTRTTTNFCWRLNAANSQSSQIVVFIKNFRNYALIYSEFLILLIDIELNALSLIHAVFARIRQLIFTVSIEPLIVYLNSFIYKFDCISNLAVDITRTGKTRSHNQHTTEPQQHLC